MTKSKECWDKIKNIGNLFLKHDKSVQTGPQSFFIELHNAVYLLTKEKQELQMQTFLNNWLETYWTEHWHKLCSSDQQKYLIYARYFCTAFGYYDKRNYEASTYGSSLLTYAIKECKIGKPCNLEIVCQTFENSLDIPPEVLKLHSHWHIQGERIDRFGKKMIASNCNCNVVVK